MNDPYQLVRQHVEDARKQLLQIEELKFVCESLESIKNRLDPNHSDWVGDASAEIMELNVRILGKLTSFMGPLATPKTGPRGHLIWAPNSDELMTRCNEASKKIRSAAERLYEIYKSQT